MPFTHISRVIITGFGRFDLIRFFRRAFHWWLYIAIFNLINLRNQTFHAFNLSINNNLFFFPFCILLFLLNWLLFLTRFDRSDSIKLIIQALEFLNFLFLYFNFCCYILNHWWIIRFLFFLLSLIRLWCFQRCSKVWHWLRWSFRILGSIGRLLLLILIGWHLVKEILINLWCHLLLLQTGTIVRLFGAHVRSLIESCCRCGVLTGLRKNIGRCSCWILLTVLFEVCGEAIDIPVGLFLWLFLQISVCFIS